MTYLVFARHAKNTAKLRRPIWGDWIGSITLATLLVAGALGSTPAGGTETSGETDFRLSCSACHGEEGRGRGEKAFGLSVEVPDLTTLRARNNGTFPRERLRQIIDGREEIGDHIDREMPVWGQLFRLDAEEGLGGGDAGNSTVQQRIDRLIDFIETLQR